MYEPKYIKELPDMVPRHEVVDIIDQVFMDSIGPVYGYGAGECPRLPSGRFSDSGLVVTAKYGHLVGKILTQLESMLTGQQLESAKSVFRQIIDSVWLHDVESVGATVARRLDSALGLSDPYEPEPQQRFRGIGRD